MAKAMLRLVGPAIENRMVTPKRKANAELRTREYLADAEVARLADAAKGNRYEHRDGTMILVAYRHRLRASELVDLRWDHIDFDTATLAVRRVKRGSPATHPGRRTESHAQAATRTRTQVAIRVHFGTGCTVHDRGVCTDG